MRFIYIITTLFIISSSLFAQNKMIMKFIENSVVRLEIDNCGNEKINVCKGTISKSDGEIDTIFCKTKGKFCSRDINYCINNQLKYNYDKGGGKPACEKIYLPNKTERWTTTTPGGLANKSIKTEHTKYYYQERVARKNAKMSRCLKEANLREKNYNKYLKNSSLSHKDIETKLSSQYSKDVLKELKNSLEDTRTDISQKKREVPIKKGLLKDYKDTLENNRIQGIALKKYVPRSLDGFGVKMTSYFANKETSINKFHESIVEKNALLEKRFKESSGQRKKELAKEIIENRNIAKKVKRLKEIAKKRQSESGISEREALESYFLSSNNSITAPTPEFKKEMEKIIRGENPERIDKIRAYEANQILHLKTESNISKTDSEIKSLNDL